MEVKERKKVTEIQEVKIGIKCDICGKVTDNPEDKSFYSFRHYHSEWGNDSIDSVEQFDVCSGICYLKQLIKSVEALKECPSAIIDEKPISFIENLIKDLS